jgi:hypothetical protein
MISEADSREVVDWFSAKVYNLNGSKDLYPNGTFLLSRPLSLGSDGEAHPQEDERHK